MEISVYIRGPFQTVFSKKEQMYESVGESPLKLDVSRRAGSSGFPLEGDISFGDGFTRRRLDNPPREDELMRHIFDVEDKTK